MQSQERGDDHGRDEERRSQRGRIDVQPELTLVDSVQEVNGTPYVERPDDPYSPLCTSEQGERCGNREDGGDEITIRGRHCKSRRQRGRYHSWDEEAETNEPEHVRNNQRKQCLFSRRAPKSRDDEHRRENGERDETHQNAEAENRQAIQSISLLTAAATTATGVGPRRV